MRTSMHCSFFSVGFLMSENVEDFDLFIVNLPKLDQLVCEENVSKLEPLFDAAFKSMYPVNFTQTFKGRTGAIMAFYLAKYGRYLVTQYTKAEYIEAIYKKYRFAESKTEFLQVDNRPLDEVHFRSSDDGYALMHHLLDRVLEKIEAKEMFEQEALYTPTALPCYIDETLYQKRVQRYKQKAKAIDVTELALAQERTKAMACRRSDEVEFRVISKEYKKDKYKHNTKMVTVRRLEVAFQMDNSSEEYYNYFKPKSVHLSAPIDIKRLASLIPTNIHLLLGSFLITTLNYATFGDRLIVNSTNSKSGDIEMLQAMLQALIEQEVVPINRITLLFIACCMLYYDATIRMLATELWIKSVQEQQLEPHRLGEILGALESAEYAPLKRLTDSISEAMLNLSVKHDRALFVLMNSMIVKMHDEPIKGVKKLLQLYVELLHVSNMSVENEVITKLELWAKTASLAPVIRKILTCKA